jgi:RNA-binding protein
MPLDPKTRKSLSAKANRIDAKTSIAGGPLADTVITHIGRTFSKDGLTKIRINTDDREECAQTARALAQRLEAELVQVVGRVALLYRTATPDSDNESPRINAS